MEAYCVKCKEKREMIDPEAVFTSRGTPMTVGRCGVCNTKLSRLGATQAHEGLEKPVIEKKKVGSEEKSKKYSKARSGKSNKKKNSKKVSSGQQNIDGVGKPLVIVESPAKARTIGKIVGNKLKVVASVGHVRDLLKSQLSVDVEDDFKPKYRVPNEKKEVVKQIKVLSDNTDKVFLATDPDREGESIAWHLMDSAEIEPKKIERVVFHEITKDAVLEAFSHPRKIDMDLVDAQQARRVLDRLVGYGVSPILWTKVRSKLSAGRVQSVALRLIVEREREIQDFIPVEYWTVAAVFQPEGSRKTYEARLFKINKLDPEINNEQEAEALCAEMRQAKYLIQKILTVSRNYKPSAPFITSTLQQEASKRIGFLTKKTMKVAQELYEGIDMGSGEETGLITYMRTDSVHLSAIAVKEARDYILKKFGKKYLPAKQPVYRTRAASAQEAHEAIRPTSVYRDPESIKEHLTNDQYKLYKLIWQRFVASQMEAAVIETTTVDILGEVNKRDFLFRASGSRVIFQGHRAVYKLLKEDESEEEQQSVNLPLDEMREGQAQVLRELEPSQHFTQPPARFTEASLIQVLEENKIGRPSTYSPIITNIQTRNYVTREQKQLIPTEIGFLVNDLVVEYFPTIVDIGFTSDMEDRLDEIAEGHQAWVNVIRDFYTPFEQSLINARKHMPESKIEPEKIGRACPLDGGDLVIRNGRFGKFISCSNFPKCRYTEPWLEKIGVACPKCADGEIVEKRTRKGRIFYGCSNYPKCDFTSWNKPLRTRCEQCGGVLVATNKNHASCLDCGTVFKLEDLPLSNE